MGFSLLLMDWVELIKLVKGLMDFCDYTMSLLGLVCLRDLRVEGLQPRGIEYTINVQKVTMFNESKCIPPNGIVHDNYSFEHGKSIFCQCF